MAKSKKDSIFGGLRGKQLLWLKFHLDDSNPKTFMNNTQSALAAGYSPKGAGQIGWEIYKKLENRIAQWIDEHGLSETRLKKKLISLVDSKQYVFQKIKGHITQEDAPPGVLVMAESHKMAWDKGDNGDATAYDDGDTIVAIPVDALETQRRSLDMALKIKGLYSKDNEQKRPEIVLADKIPPEKREALNKAYQQILKG